jgi:hypothetical protein
LNGKAIKLNKKTHNEVKRNMASQGLDIEEVDPDSARQVAISKMKFEQEKKAFERANKKKFKSNMCDN